MAKLQSLKLKEGGPEAESDGVDQYLLYLEGLIDDEDLSWALDTLDGIRGTIAQTRRITEGQRDAISNIVNRSRPREEKRGGSRRRTGGVYRSISPKAPGGSLYKELKAKVEQQTRESEPDLDLD